ncbi:hypothetical protein E2C01_007468 [Portunus trituberculatus]|uniref:Uncharacterized protein n=1 Tax=Portunus trituberculatus TaxID=210409 RepID=A0A5B7CY01_PORTR|nr:hypothetical protein [Portunus trituberculatus]
MLRRLRRLPRLSSGRRRGDSPIQTLGSSVTSLGGGAARHGAKRLDAPFSPLNTCLDYFTLASKTSRFSPPQHSPMTHHRPPRAIPNVNYLPPLYLLLKPVTGRREAAKQ